LAGAATFADHFFEFQVALLNMFQISEQVIHLEPVDLGQDEVR
jgi:hypothetical protein